MNIILITDSFPYMPGEQFLETEIKYYKNVKLNILPLHTHKEKRRIDLSIEVNDCLFEYKDQNKLYKIVQLCKNIFSKYFFQEALKNNLFNFQNILTFNGSMNIYYFYYDAFDTYFKNQINLDNTVVYTYWNNEATYALQSLKRKYNYKLVSRVHGWDIYKERRKNGYMPLKSQFTKNIDKIFTITENANEYLHVNYGFDYDILKLSRLGVEDHNIISRSNKDNILHLVSCSFLTEVKRIDKLIEAIGLISSKNMNINYIWTHIGGGQLYDQLNLLAQKLLGSKRNVTFNFLGNLNNNEVYEFYKNNNVDVFVNTSDSEGVPVSIMEAMSCYIPIIAPNIGGISDMVVSDVNGFLLSNECKINEVVEALNQQEYLKNKKVREASYKVYNNKYNAQKNYTNFLKALLSIEGTSIVNT